jgi:hypothetical protein
LPPSPLEALSGDCAQALQAGRSGHSNHRLLAVEPLAHDRQRHQLGHRDVVDRTRLASARATKRRPTAGLGVPWPEELAHVLARRPRLPARQPDHALADAAAGALKAVRVANAPRQHLIPDRPLDRDHVADHRDEPFVVARLVEGLRIEVVDGRSWVGDAEGPVVRTGGLPSGDRRGVASVEPGRLLGLAGRIHGVHGVGKTTFAAGAPDPVFVLTEDGLGTLEVPHFPLARTFDEVMQALAALYTEQHGFKTLVVDSVDWLEPLIHAKVCKDQGWSSIEDAGYGKGYVAAVDPWRQYLEGLNALRDDKGMAIVQLAHTDIKRFDSPESEPYDRYIIKLHSKASALLQEHSDIVLFANYRVSTIKSDVGFNKKVTRALGSGERLLHTAERPAFLAKNRNALPETLPMSWAALAEAMPRSILPDQKET